MAVSQKLLFHPPVEPNSPVYWFMMQIAMIFGFITSFPMNWFLIRSGIKERHVKSKMLSDIEGVREWVVIFDPGDEVMAGLKRFAADEHLSAAHFTGIGAFAEVTVGWFNLQKQDYEPIHIAEQVEVLSLIGDVAESERKPAVHAHICVAKHDGTRAWGASARRQACRPTLELIVSESPAHLRKTFKKQFGLALIDLDRASRPLKDNLKFSLKGINHVNQCWPICDAAHAGMGHRANLRDIPAMESMALLAGLRKNENKPRFIQARHEELAAFMASAHAKFTGTVGVCMATSGPGAIHLLNGLYDAKMDHQPVVAIVGQSATTAIGSQYQQEVDLQSLFKDVASEYCVTVMSPAAVRHCVDRAFRIAMDQKCRHVHDFSEGHSGRNRRCPSRRKSTIMR